MKTKKVSGQWSVVSSIAAMIVAGLLMAPGLSVAQTFNPPTMTVGNASPTNALTVYGSPLKLFSVQGTSISTSLLYVQVFETITGATNGAIPKMSFPVPATNFFSVDFSYYGANLDKCKVCISSNLATLTLTPSNAVSIQAVIKAPQ